MDDTKTPAVNKHCLRGSVDERPQVIHGQPMLIIVTGIHEVFRQAHGILIILSFPP
jgi:hypothetical protein